MISRRSDRRSRALDVKGESKKRDARAEISVVFLMKSIVLWTLSLSSFPVVVVVAYGSVNRFASAIYWSGQIVSNARISADMFLDRPR